jgi:membrane protein implicated in regulation of membrane protease activity
MRRIVFGLFLCVAGLIALNLHQTVIGLPLFVYGIVLMYGGKWPKGPRDL